MAAEARFLADLLLYNGWERLDACKELLIVSIGDANAILIEDKRVAIGTIIALIARNNIPDVVKIEGCTQEAEQGGFLLHSTWYLWSRDRRVKIDGRFLRLRRVVDGRDKVFAGDDCLEVLARDKELAVRLGGGWISQAQLPLWIDERAGGIVFIAEGARAESILRVDSQRGVVGRISWRGQKLLYRRHLGNGQCIEKAFMEIGIDQLHARFGVALHHIIGLRDQLRAHLPFAEAQRDE